MAIQMNVATRNARLDAIESTNGTSCSLEIRSSSIPANCAAASAGVVLATINLPSDWLGSASAGSKTILGTWQDLQADASGIAGHFRLYNSQATKDGTTCFMQGLVSQPWVSSTAFTVNQQVSNGGNVYRCATAGTSASSGGPTGTGSGIADGSCSWNFVGTIDMDVVNTNFAINQQFTVNTFTLNEGSA